MKAKTGIVILSIAAFAFSCQQKQTRSLDRKVEKNVRRLADHIVSHTQRAFVDTSTQKEVAAEDVKKQPCRFSLASDYLKWYYPNGVLHVGMKRLAKALDEQKYSEYVSKNYRFIFNYYPLFESCYEPGYPYEAYFREQYTPFWQLFMMSELDHCGAMGAGLLEEYQDHNNSKYRRLIDTIADYIMNGQVRLDDGTLVRTTPRKYSLWTDDLYMSVPFLARMGELTGKQKYFDDAVKQISQFREYVYNEDMNIFHHFWFSDTVVEPFAYWGRANGWAVMAQTELLTYLPANYPKRDKVLRYFRQHIQGISELQDKSGLWHQLLNKDDSYLETSCSAMFLYGIARGIRKGWLDESYKDVLHKGWEGLITRINEEGVLHDICIGTPIGMDIDFYYNRPRSAGDTHGTAAAIVAGAEMMMLNKQ